MNILFKVSLTVIVVWFIIMFSFGLFIGMVVDVNRGHINSKMDCNLDYSSVPAIFFIPSQMGVAESFKRNNLCLD